MTQEDNNTNQLKNQSQLSHGGGLPCETKAALARECAHDSKPACPRCHKLLDGFDLVSHLCVSPSLVNNGQIRTQNNLKPTWSRKQKRTYKNLINWLHLKIGQKYQILRVDLTSASRKENNLTQDFKKLRRIIENHFNYEIEYFKIETHEGNGVLHMIWCIKHPTAVWIPQKWLSRVWQDITGAHRVWISRMGAKRGHDGKYYKAKSLDLHAKSIAGYMAGQYLANQDAIKRISWSWHRNDIDLVDAFRCFGGLCKRGAYEVGKGLTYLNLKRWEFFHAWGELLRNGSLTIGNRLFTFDYEAGEGFYFDDNLEWITVEFTNN